MPSLPRAGYRRAEAVVLPKSPAPEVEAPAVPAPSPPPEPQESPSPSPVPSPEPAGAVPPAPVPSAPPAPAGDLLTWHWRNLAGNDQDRLPQLRSRPAPGQEWRGLGPARITVRALVPASGGAPGQVEVRVVPEGDSSLPEAERKARLEELARELVGRSRWEAGLRAGLPADHEVEFLIELAP